MTASSTSMIDSISDSLISARIDQRAAGVGRRLQGAGHAAELGPWPIGTLSSTHCLAEQLLDVVDQGREVDVLGDPSC